ncbi:MAG: hypothetical protein FWH06_00805 [Oscillospiraceae bacterium]|nr:hypothetical protein [Oscillospiraceae bacterium]
MPIIDKEQRYAQRVGRVRRHTREGKKSRAIMTFDGSEAESAPDIWDHGRKYKKGDKVWHMKTDFLRWIDHIVSITVADGALCVAEREAQWGSLDFPYRKIGMLPGHIYTVSVDYSPTGSQYHDRNEDKMFWQRLQIACGKAWEWRFNYDDLYVDTYSSGLTPPGQWETVTFDLDFRGMEKIPGVMRIQELREPLEPQPFYLKNIRITENGAEVYVNTFEFGTYVAARSSTGENPFESTAWTKTSDA